MDLLNPIGRNETVRAELRAAAQEIITPIQGIQTDLNRIFSTMRQLTRSLNQLCGKNGFLNAENKTQAHLIANSQTFMVGSLANLSSGEIGHIDKVAQLYFKSNYPTPESQKIVLRSSPFYGGRSSNEVEEWPPAGFFEGKKKP